MDWILVIPSLPFLRLSMYIHTHSTAEFWHNFLTLLYDYLFTTYVRVLVLGFTEKTGGWAFGFAMDFWVVGLHASSHEMTMGSSRTDAYSQHSFFALPIYRNVLYLPNSNQIRSGRKIASQSIIINHETVDRSRNESSTKHNPSHAYMSIYP